MASRRSQVWNRNRQCGPTLTARLRFERFKYLFVCINSNPLTFRVVFFIFNGISPLIFQEFEPNREMFPYLNVRFLL